MATTMAAPHGEHRALSAAVWVAQALLGLAFLGAGAMKLGTPIAELAKAMAWVSDVPAWLVRFIGVCETAGAIGVVLPALTRVRPYLTIAAAVALAALMATATLFHLTRLEYGALPPPLLLGALAVFVAWGRGPHHAAIEPREPEPPVR